METDLQEELRAILTKLENAIAHDILLRQSQSRSGRSPKSIHAEAIASLTSLINREKVKELQSMEITWQQHYPDFKFDPSPETHKRIWNSMIEERIKTLTPGGSDNDQ